MIFSHAMFRVRKSSYFQCFNSILYCPSAKFNLGLLIFIDVAVLLYRRPTCYFFIGSRRPFSQKGTNNGKDMAINF